MKLARKELKKLFPDMEEEEEWRVSLYRIWGADVRRDGMVLPARCVHEYV